VNFNRTVVKIGVVGRIVYELGQLSLSHLGSAVTENEKQSVDGIRFPRTVGAHDGRERLRDRDEFERETDCSLKMVIPCGTVQFPVYQRRI